MNLNGSYVSALILKFQELVSLSSLLSPFKDKFQMNSEILQDNCDILLQSTKCIFKSVVEYYSSIVDGLTWPLENLSNISWVSVEF